MKVTVDSELCQGHGQCEEAAPEIFEVRDDGVSYVLADANSPDLENKVRRAISRCPVDAIMTSP